MARRGKTKVGGPVDTRAMLAAGQSQRAATQAEKETAAFHERGAQDIQRGAGAADQAIQYQTEKLKQEKIRGEETAFREKQFKEKQLQAQTAEQQRQEQLNIQAASQGMQLKGERPETPREQALREEMERGSTQQADPGLERLRQQGEKPLEVPGEGQPTIPGGGRGGAAEYEIGQERREAEADARAEKALQNQLRRQKLEQDIQRARIKGDQEGVEMLQDRLGTQIDSNVNRLNRVMGGKGTPNDWSAIKSMAEEAGDESLLAELQQAQDTGMVGGRVRDFLTNEIIVGDGGVLDYIAVDGEMPKKGVDPSNPAMQQFYQNIGVVSAALREAHAANPQDVIFRGIRTYEDKIRFIQSEAAARTKRELSGRDKQSAMNQVMASQQADPQQQAYMDQQRREGITQQQEAQGISVYGRDPSAQPDVGPQPWQWKATQEAEKQRTAQAQKEVTKRAGPLP